MTCFYKVLILFPVLFFFSLSSCGWVKRTQVKSAMDEVHQKLMSRDFQDALDTYQLAHKKYPKDSEMLKNYIETIEYMKAYGDKAFDRENFVQAQITYDLLLKNFPRFSDFANLLSFKEDLIATRLRKSRTLHAEKEAQSFMKRGDFKRGIDIYRSLIQQYPADTTVRNRYIYLLDSIKAQADVDLKRKDFASAGRTYRILLENYSSLSNLKQFLSYDAGILDAGINTCRKILFENGLKHYRCGNLSQAISIWENILTFDPGDQEVKKAADMAILQSRNLEKIK